MVLKTARFGSNKHKLQKPTKDAAWPTLSKATPRAHLPQLAGQLVLLLGGLLLLLALQAHEMRNKGQAGKVEDPGMEHAWLCTATLMHDAKPPLLTFFCVKPYFHPPL